MIAVAARAWMGAVGMMAVQGTVLAIVALALTRAGRLRPSWTAAIWLVVIAKFALPWGPAMPWSLADLVAGLWHHTPEVAASTLPPALAAPVVVASPSSAWIVLALAWAIGAAIVLARAARAELRAVLAVRALPWHDHELVRIRVGDDRVGPHVVGVLRPTIVVPRSLLADPELLRAALLHELAHVRRRDGLGKLVQIVAIAMSWFWPVVRLVGKKLDLAREAACDAAALEASDLPRPAYARLLVRMSQLHSPAPALAMPHALDARIAAVLGPPARARLTVVHKLALLAWIALALGGARTASAHTSSVCKYTPQLAEQLYVSHPEADRDGDGTLSRDEACELQAELRRQQAEPNKSQLSPPLAASDAELLEEPLCCNCERAEVYSTPETASCQSPPGVER